MGVAFLSFNTGVGLIDAMFPVFTIQEAGWTNENYSHIFSIVNIDSTLCLENPKIMSYVLQMQDLIAAKLNVTRRDISIKATTTEQMGFIGREEGLMAYATVLLKKEETIL